MKISHILVATLTLLMAFAWQASAQRYQPYMRSAIEHLQQARADLDRGAHNKGGHRVRAITLIDEAIAEVQKGDAAR